MGACKEKEVVKEQARMLFSVEESAQILGGVSPWTLRRHVQRGNIRVVRLGDRTLLDYDELSRIRREGLPRLTAEPPKKSFPPRERTR